MSVRPQSERSVASSCQPIPRSIASPRGKLVYHTLDAAGPGTVAELSDRLAMKKITLLSVLGSLVAGGYVERRGDRYVTR